MTLKKGIVGILLLISLVAAGVFGRNVYFGYPKNNSAACDVYYTFNPHVFPSKLYVVYGEERQKAFFSLCDALRAGESSFECSSQDIYEWCFRDDIIKEFFPVAQGYVSGYEPEIGYCDGKGMIKYNVPKYAFLEKETAFENDVTEVLRQYVRRDYSDFEKCLALYDYIEKNYEYDYEELDIIDKGDMDEFYARGYGTYKTFMDKKGVCDEISGLYDYLLLQCGVDALKYNGITVEDEKHAWSYVTIDGTGYHVDPTWGITNDMCLKYFMMPSDVRGRVFMDKTVKPAYFGDEYEADDVEFWADDDRFASLREGTYLDYDVKRKVVCYEVDDEVKEFYYGNLKSVPVYG